MDVKKQRQCYEQVLSSLSDVFLCIRVTDMKKNENLDFIFLFHILILEENLEYLGVY